ncbi:hypothetical protein [Amycolatopsis minnesotensis]|uniref:Uncharacterized protein n=1 Tax=Amycolatopsis minnesotensis TaxID=337894 RepID=A0ABP5D020_9PSEU
MPKLRSSDIAAGNSAAAFVTAAPRSASGGIGQSGRVQVTEEQPQGFRHVGRVLRGGRQRPWRVREQEFLDQAGRPVAQPPVDTLVPEIQRRVQREPIDRVVVGPDGTAPDQQVFGRFERLGVFELEVGAHRSFAVLTVRERAQVTADVHHDWGMGFRTPQHARGAAGLPSHRRVFTT